MRTTVKSFFSATLLLVFCLSAFSQQVAKSIPNSTSPDGVIGFLEFRPKDYGSQKHPLIIFLHGIGERGNGTSQINSVTANAIPKFCAAGASMQFTVGGQTSSFVVLSPQLSVQYGYWPTFYVKEMIKYAKANLQIDPNRIYVTGLSLGGGGVWRAITEVTNSDYSFDAGIAAAAPCCGTQEEIDANVCSTIAANHLPVWAFHSMDDGTVGVGCTQHAEILMSQCSGINPAGKFTYYQSGGHGGAWINAFDTGHIITKVNGGGNFTASPNLYEWFLSNTRSSQPSYTAPVANAGNAQTVTSPTNSITLTGTGTGTNGASISSYAWVKASGPSAGISNPGSASTAVTGLSQGTYVFTLTVTDNHGLTNSSNTTVIVNGTANTAPVANAGNAQTVTSPNNSIILTGTGTGTNGASISSYAWVKASGPSAGISNPGSPSTAITGLSQGTYVFTLTVTDNHGLTNSSNVTITVNAAPNTAPVANAGNAQTITLPTNSIVLSGTGTGTNGASISAYTWTKASGPSAGISSPGSASTAVTGLSQGTYVFTLTVTDNHGLTNSSNVTITVNAAANTAPVANAGNAQTLTLPTNSIVLSGTGTGTNGASISAYAWTKASGPSAGISNPGSASTAVTGLSQGTYVFMLTITDNHGLTNSSNVTITVNAAVAAIAGQPIGYIKQSTGSWQACGDASSSGRIAVYSSSIANGNVLYLDASHTKPFNGGWNWFSYTQSIGGIVNQAFAVYPDGTIHLLNYCSNGVPSTTAPAAPVAPPVTAPVAPPVMAPATGNLLGYIKMSVGPYQACDDASSTGRTAIYGSGSIANGTVVYADAAQTQPYNGGWNWFSFTPVLGGSTTYAFAIYPNGGLFLLRNCATGARMMAPATTAEEDIATLKHLKDSATAAGLITVKPARLNMYPNPVHTTATIELYSADNSVKSINLYNSNGVLVAKYSWQTVAGNNVFSLKNVSGLTNGLYIVDIRDNTGKPLGSLKFLKM